MDLSKLFKTSTERFEIREDKLTNDQKKLFNGFDEIGGDITMYDDAVNWFENCTNKNEALTLSIIVLDKPTTYLFGGMKNSEIKMMSEIYPRIVSLIADINMDGMSQANIEVKQMGLKMLVDGCSVLTMDGTDIKFVGEKKTPMDQTLLRTMPMYKDNEIESFSDDQINTMCKSRMWWNGKFALVNVSRMKRLAMMYLELCDDKKMIPAASKWCNNHKGRPSSATNFGKNETTAKIMKEDIKVLKRNRQLWRKHKKVLNAKFPRDPATGDCPKLSDIQTGFLSRMKLNDGLTDLLWNDVSPEDPDETTENE